MGFVDAPRRATTERMSISASRWGTAARTCRQEGGGRRSGQRPLGGLHPVAALFAFGLLLFVGVAYGPGCRPAARPWVGRDARRDRISIPALA
jgi:hypothetical protein